MSRPTIGALLSCHIPHLSAGQLFYAGAVAMVFAGLCEGQIGTKSFFVLWLLSSFTVSLSVLYFEGQSLSYFCGASGIGHAFAACWAVNHDSKAARVLFLMGLGGKVIFEMVTGTVSYEIGLEGARPVPLAHCAGAVVGVLYGLVLLRRRIPSQASTETLLRTGI